MRKKIDSTRKPGKAIYAKTTEQKAKEKSRKPTLSKK